MFHLVTLLLTFALFIGLTAAIILIDSRRQRAAARERGDVDFMDRSLAPYLVLAFLCGALPLFFYFGVTRKGARGWLLGRGAVIAVFVIVAIAGSGIIAASSALQHSVTHASNVALFARAKAACGTFDPAHAADDPCRKVLDGGEVDQVSIPQDEPPYFAIYVGACDSGRVWS